MDDSTAIMLFGFSMVGAVFFIKMLSGQCIEQDSKAKKTSNSNPKKNIGEKVLFSSSKALFKKNLKKSGVDIHTIPDDFYNEIVNQTLNTAKNIASLKNDLVMNTSVDMIENAAWQVIEILNYGRNCKNFNEDIDETLIKLSEKYNLI